MCVGERSLGVCCKANGHLGRNNSCFFLIFNLGSGIFVDGVSTWIWVLNIDVSCKFMNLFFCLACGVFVGCGILVRLWGGPYKWRRWTKTGFMVLHISSSCCWSPNDPNGWTVQQFKTDGIVLPLPCVICMYIYIYIFNRFVWMSFNFQQFFHFGQKSLGFHLACSINNILFGINSNLPGYSGFINFNYKLRQNGQMCIMEASRVSRWLEDKTFFLRF